MQAAMFDEFSGSPMHYIFSDAESFETTDGTMNLVMDWII